MNLSKLSVILPSIAFVAVQTLSAASITVSTGGTACAGEGFCTSRAGASTISFNGLDGQLMPTVFNGEVTFSGNPGSAFVTGSLDSNWATPVGDSSTYLTVGSPQRPATVEINFANAISYYGFYMGSPDTYNRIEFFSNNTLIQGFNGDDLIDPATGAQQVGEFINFDAQGTSVDRIVLTSTSAAFETDNHAYTASAVPEPTSIALAGLGLGLVAALRARRSRS